MSRVDRAAAPGPHPHPQITVAGLGLELQVDGRAHGMQVAFDRIVTIAPDPEAIPDPDATTPLVVGRLRISSNEADFLHPRYRGLVPGQYRFADGGVVLHNEQPPQIQAFRPGGPEGERPAGAELEMLLSPEALQAGDLIAHPANFALAGWLASHGHSAVHAAGIALDGRGLLLIGEGGQGKTTTALAAVQRGFAYLGDDLCVVTSGSAEPDGPTLHGLYSTCKVNPDTEARLGLSGWRRLGVTPKQKTVLQLPAGVPFATSVPLAAVVLVSPGPDPSHASRPTALPAPHAMRAMAGALAPFVRVAGASAEGLAAMVSLVRRVPVMRLVLSWDLDAAVDQLAAIARGRIAVATDST